MSASLYIDTSAILRVVLEAGQSPELETRVNEAAYLATSWLTKVEAARALLRLRARAEVDEARLMDAQDDVRDLLARCVLHDISQAVCELASSVSPDRPVRSLDALHLATYFLARRDLAELELVTEDRRLRAALLPDARG